MRAFAKKLFPANFRTRVSRAFKLGLIDRETIANKYLSGSGIEIGALHTPLKVPQSAHVKYVDRMSVADLRSQYPELADHSLVEPDIIADGELLESVSDSSQDFVIANHFLEHCQNTFLALLNMYRVLKPGGILYLAIPDKRYTFDVDRLVTDLEHLLRDFNKGPEQSRRDHYEEWSRLVDKVAGEREVAHTTALMEKDYSIHFHAWTQKELLEIVGALHEHFNLNFELELFLSNESECILVLRKTTE
jgi:SAM-dependent methyltransferase